MKNHFRSNVGVASTDSETKGGLGLDHRWLFREKSRIKGRFLLQGCRKLSPKNIFGNKQSATGGVFFFVLDLNIGGETPPRVWRLGFGFFRVPQIYGSPVLGCLRYAP